MGKKIIHTEEGQSLVLLVILLLGMLAILALVLDGGNLFGKRRLAQNAADAGALAGARTLCYTDDETQAEYQANQYAASNLLNSANQIDIGERRVTVTSTLTFGRQLSNEGPAGRVFSARLTLLRVTWTTREFVRVTCSSSSDGSAIRSIATGNYPLIGLTGMEGTSFLAIFRSGKFGG